jgi:L-ascorbate metabolism protein UlaG (beta-lactamase superfamily)
VFFAGDTDLFPGMSGLVPDLDLALVPVWGWGATLGAGHLDPLRAAEALSLLRPRRAIPIHWGTFVPLHRSARADFLRRPVEEFVEAARKKAPDVEIRVLNPGEAFAE